MKLEIDAGKKSGLPNYGQVSARIAITVDVPDTLGEDYEALRERLLLLQSLARSLVEADIAAQVAAPTSPAPIITRPMTPAQTPAPAPAPVPTPDDRSAPRPIPPPSPGDLHAGQGATLRYDGKRNGVDIRKTREHCVPKNGNQLHGWLKDRDAEYGTRLVSHVRNWAQLNQIPGMMIEWDTDTANWGFNEAVKKLNEWKKVHPIANGAVLA